MKSKGIRHWTSTSDTTRINENYVHIILHYDFSLWWLMFLLGLLTAPLLILFYQLFLLNPLWAWPSCWWNDRSQHIHRNSSTCKGCWIRLCYADRCFLLASLPPPVVLAVCLACFPISSVRINTTLMYKFYFYLYLMIEPQLCGEINLG